MARYLSMASSVNAGANEVKRANFGSKLEQRKAVHENGWSVATLSPSLKAKGGSEFKVSGIVRTRARKAEQH